MSGSSQSSAESLNRNCLLRLLLSSSSSINRAWTPEAIIELGTVGSNIPLSQYQIKWGYQLTGPVHLRYHLQYVHCANGWMRYSNTVIPWWRWHWDLNADAIQIFPETELDEQPRLRSDESHGWQRIWMAPTNSKVFKVKKIYCEHTKWNIQTILRTGYTRFGGLFVTQWYFRCGTICQN